MCLHVSMYARLQCEWAEENSIHLYYVTCNTTNHYAGGTESGPVVQRVAVARERLCIESNCESLTLCNAHYNHQHREPSVCLRDLPHHATTT